MTPLPMLSKSKPSDDADLLARTHVAKPCPARWEQMAGDDQSRFCGSCKKNVYNLSAMTAKEAANLIREKEGKLCIRYYQRADGTVMTQDCPVGVEAFKRKVRRTFAASIVGAATLLMTISEGMRFANNQPSLFAERLKVWAQRIHPEPIAEPVPPVPPVTPPVTVVAGAVAIRPAATPEPLPNTMVLGEMVAPEQVKMGKPVATREVRGQATVEQK